MPTIEFDASFNAWRHAARRLLNAHIPPHEVTWRTQGFNADLFAQGGRPTAANDAAYASPLRLTRTQLELLETAALYRADDKWAVMYRALWRLFHGEHGALRADDRDGALLHRWTRAVRREAHHMYAFLRFRRQRFAADAPPFVAWYEPAHDVLDSAAAHFAARMGAIAWLIATPDGVACCDGTRLKIERPCPRAYYSLAHTRQEDSDEAPWLAHFRGTFPAHLDVHAMGRHLLPRLWRGLPEGSPHPRSASRGESRDPRLHLDGDGARQQRRLALSP